MYENEKDGTQQLSLRGGCKPNHEGMRDLTWGSGRLRWFLLWSCRLI